MKRRVALRGCLAIVAASTLSPHAVADDDRASLEMRLRAIRPDIVRWETRLIETHPRPPKSPKSMIESIGRIGPRTAVRFGDGRVRWYVVSGFRPVAVATRALEYRDAVTASDVTVDERDVIGLGCEAVEIDGERRWRAARRIGRGDALCARVVEPMPDIERNGPVLLSAHSGAVSVSRVLTAAADARAGERVRLRDRATGTTISAIVTGPGAARVSGENP
jgi:flagella basal body P-ring formation protein FlgA